MQGTPAREVFLVERGLIKLLHLGENGEEFIVGLRSTGSIIGAASVIVQEPFPFSAITTTWCKVRQIHAEMFIHLAKNDLQFCWNLHQMLGHEVHQQASQLFAFKNLSARQRFENLLRQFASTVTAQATSLARQVSLPLKHWEIAQLIGVTPEHLSRTIRQMQTEGILLKANGRLVISDVTKLYQASDLS
jgi:CRP/FNR family transcriptional regulator